MPIPMQSGSQRHLARSAQNRESRIDLGAIGSEPGSKSSTPANHLEQIARTAERISTSWRKLSPATDTGGEMEKGIGKQTEKATEPEMRKPSGSAHRQPPSGKGEIPITVRHESPWKMYKKGYELKFEDFVIVAVRLSPNSGKVAIKNYNRREGERSLDMLNIVRHAKFISFLEVFEWDQMFFAVFEHVFVSLVR
ncbi:hypothetical protein LTR93_011505 [Exophiala xenobiotica]|nr:hypothetical protein LTR93_011505 [Exophiala xenobiotica]